MSPCFSDTSTCGSHSKDCKVFASVKFSWSGSRSIATSDSQPVHLFGIPRYRNVGIINTLARSSQLKKRILVTRMHLNRSPNRVVSVRNGFLASIITHRGLLRRLLDSSTQDSRYNSSEHLREKLGIVNLKAKEKTNLRRPEQLLEGSKTA